MPIPLGFKGWIAYGAWLWFGMLFYHFLLKPEFKPHTHPSSEDHRRGFPVGFQPDFWQWQLFAESRDDLEEISKRMNIWPAPTMAIKSIQPGSFGMVCGSENPGRSACVIFPTKPTEIQMGFSRRAHRGVLAHECGHIVLSTAKWTQRFAMVDLILSIPLTLLFTYMLGQIAAYIGLSSEQWGELCGWLLAFHVPYILAVMFGKLGERLISRIHEFGCDSITAVAEEGEGLVEAFHGFKKFTRQLVLKKSMNRRIAWYLLTVPYREVWGTHPNLARRINNCRASMR